MHSSPSYPLRISPPLQPNSKRITSHESANSKCEEKKWENLEEKKKNNNNIYLHEIYIVFVYIFSFASLLEMKQLLG